MITNKTRSLSRGRAVAAAMTLGFLSLSSAALPAHAGDGWSASASVGHRDDRMRIPERGPANRPPHDRYGPPARYPVYRPIHRGIFVPMLPRYYTTVYFGGLPYYQANNIYYSWSPAQRSYEVVTPPPQPVTTPSASSGPDQLFTYPKAGQSAQQQSQDRYECHSWASGQTGFDPTQAAGGVPVNDTAARRGDYMRAITACLQARNYSVT